MVRARNAAPDSATIGETNEKSGSHNGATGPRVAEEGSVCADKVSGGVGASGGDDGKGVSAAGAGGGGGGPEGGGVGEPKKDKKKGKKKKQDGNRGDGTVGLGGVKWPVHPTTVFVRGFGVETTSETLKEAFLGAGVVVGARVVEDKKTHAKKVCVECDF